MKLSVNMTRIISFSRKTTLLGSDYQLCESSTTHSDWIKDLAVFVESKLHLHYHVDYIFTQLGFWG